MNNAIEHELEQIRAAAGGVLRPEAVVAFARDPDTALHGQFCWDDTEAARLYRLVQARQVIRCTVRQIAVDTKPTRVYVSIKEDRSNGNGYRHVRDVMNDSDRRAALLAQAKKEMVSFIQRYRSLRELARTIEHMEEAIRDEPESDAG